MYIHIYIYIVIPEASGPQQLKLIRFQIYRDIPVTRPQYCLLRIHCMPLFIYIYLFQYIHKKFIVSTTYHDIPCSNSYMLYQSRYSICLYKYIYISHWSMIYLSLQRHCLYHWLLCIYIYIYLPLADRWLTIYLSVHMYIPFYIVSPIYHYIYISISHWLTIGLYNVSPKKT